MIAINSWVFSAALGFAVHGDAWGAAVGLAVSSGITLVINVVVEYAAGK